MKGIVLSIRRFFSRTVGGWLLAEDQVPAQRVERRPARPASRQARTASSTARRHAPAAANPAPEKSRWRAVSIKPCNAACAAVRDVAGKRFLQGEVPDIPLRDCDSGDCKCIYQHHEDRRDPENDRRQYEAASQTLLYGQLSEDGCRRSRRGRRKSD